MLGGRELGESLFKTVTPLGANLGTGRKGMVRAEGCLAGEPLTLLETACPNRERGYGGAIPVTARIARICFTSAVLAHES